MQKDIVALAACYRRRAFYTTVGAFVGMCLFTVPHPAGSQDAPPAVPADAGTKKDAPAKAGQGTSNRQGTRGKAATPSLKVVPVPRSDTRAIDPQGAPPSTTGNAGQGAAPPGGVGPGGAGQGNRRRFRGNGGGFGQGGFPGGFNGFGARGGPYQFDFHGADITNVLRLYSMMSGLTIATDPGLTGPVTIINPRPVSLDDAFKILQSVLAVRGYTALQNGNVLSILPFNLAKNQTTIVSPDIDSGQVDPRNQVMTQVIPLENVDASQMAKDLLPLVNIQASLIGIAGTNSLILTDTASNVKRFIDLVGALDKTSSRTELKVYPLRHAEATAVAQTITDLYSKISPRGDSGAGPQPGGQPRFQPLQFNQQQQQGAGPNSRPAVVAVADTRTNSVMVVASPDNQEQIARDIISRLDDEDSALEADVIKIKYSNATDVANLVNQVLSNLHGSANQSNNNNRFGGFNPFGFGGFGGGNQQQQVTSTDPFGQVTADARTNSLFVTANNERMTRIKELVKQIDVEVPFETTTFVIPLKKAKAEDVAYALSQAFGTTSSTTLNTTSGTTAASRNSGNSTSSRTNSNRAGTSSSSLPGFSGRAVPPPPNAPDGGAYGDGVPGIMTDQGFIPTGDGSLQSAQEAGKNGTQTRQVFGGFFGGGQNQRRQGNTNSTLSTTPQYGRGTNGSYSNLLQLQNNVFVTPSPDGNSLIVTTTPDNYRSLQQIIEQLDIIPQQVMIEVIIAEVTLDADQKFGLNIAGLLHKLFDQNNTLQGQISLPATGFSPSTSIDPTQAGAQFLLSGTNFSSLLQALNTDNKVKVMSTPRIFTSNAQQADIDINTYVPYIQGQTTNGAIVGATTTVSNNVQYLPIGVTITVTPRITRDGQVTMDLTQDLSDLVQFDQLNTGQGTISAPRYNLRHADTSITVQNGQTIVVGGLIRDSQTLTTSRVPLLSEVPLIGQFFRSREKVTNRVELVIFVTPHVVDTDAKAQALSQQYGGPVISQMPEIKNSHPELLLPGSGKQPDKTKKSPKTTDTNGQNPQIPNTPPQGPSSNPSSNP